MVLGSSLDLTFDVQPDTGSDVASSCVAATVKSGDAQLSESKVFVTPLPETSGRTGVRVQASVAIDEPIVQVTLTAGCAGRVARTCRIPDDCIDSKRYPLFIARAVLKELIESLQSIQGVKPC